MGGDQQELKGPDLRQGVELDRLEEGEPFLGHADGEAVLLVRRGEEVLAVGGTCTHYGGPLAEGLVEGDRVHCPWHHACFSLRTGEPESPPALDPVARWDVSVDGDRVRVTGKAEAEARPSSPRERPESVVVIGAGAAGTAAVIELRRRGYTGPITVVDPDRDAPYDRPNLSKDYLAGEAPEEWVPLRPADFYETHDVERSTARATRLDTEARTVELSDGGSLPYGALLLATGSRPRTLDVPGAERTRVLRSLADCRGIIEAAERGSRAVILGSSFIGMEAAAALRNRELDVTVVSKDEVPFARILGDELGRFLTTLHERHGVAFRLGRTVAEVEDGTVRLDDGSELPADLVLVGIGVDPETELAESAGLDVGDGVVVDARLRTSAPDVYAAGDIARYPDPRTGAPIRIEHWVVAERHGRTAARNMLGLDEPVIDPPFFWTAHYDVTLGYVGHAADWTEARLEGDPEERDAAVRLLGPDGETRALITLFRDRESLEAEVAMRQRAASGR